MRRFFSRFSDSGRTASWFLAFPIRDALRHELTWTRYRLLGKVKNEAIARYSAIADGKQLFASKYVLELPSVEQLEAQMESTRREFEEGGVWEARRP